MNAEATNPAEAIWSYLHGELSAEERRSFELALKQDQVLGERFEEACRMDRLLRSTAPSETEDAALDALAEQALAAWERERAISSDPFAAAQRAAFPKWGWLQGIGRPAVGLAGAAVAAVLLVVLSPVFRTSNGVSWSEPVFTPLALRGPAAPAGGHALDAVSAKRCQAALMAALKRSAEVRGVALPPGLVISFRMQELQGGTFSVSVQAQLKGGAGVGEWSGDYSSVESFLKHTDASAGRMVEACISLSGAGGGETRP